MATKTEKKSFNVHARLIEARERLINSNLKKSGVNSKLEYLYLELKDFVPQITSIFNEVGLVGITTFNNDYATLIVVNTDDREDIVAFTLPLIKNDVIVSNSGKQVTTELQALGSTVTYYRRYLYQLALDIVVPDEIEPQLGTNKESNTSNSKPKTAVERKEISNEIVNPSSEVTKEQLQELKSMLIKIVEKTGEKYSNIVATISTQSQGFKSAEKTQFDEWLEQIKVIMNEESVNEVA